MPMADGSNDYPGGYYKEWTARLAFIIVFEVCTYAHLNK